MRCGTASQASKDIILTGEHKEFLESAEHSVFIANKQELCQHFISSFVSSGTSRSKTYALLFWAQLFKTNDVVS